MAGSTRGGLMWAEGWGWSGGSEENVSGWEGPGLGGGRDELCALGAELIASASGRCEWYRAGVELAWSGR